MKKGMWSLPKGFFRRKFCESEIVGSGKIEFNDTWAEYEARLIADNDL